MNLEEIEKRTNFVVTTNADKMPERIEAAEVILREDVSSLISEVKRLRWQIVKKDKKIERLKLLLEQAISIIESSVLDPSWPEVLAQKSCNKKLIERVSDEFGRD